MKIAGMSFFQLASQKMQWLAARQVVISENIANADTPDYKAKEVASFQSMEQAARRPDTNLRRTHDDHIGGAPRDHNVIVDGDSAAWEASIDGNTVSLEQQTIKAAEVGESYRMAAQLYRKGHDLLSLAVTGIR